MAILRNTTFSGVAATDVEVAGPVAASHHRTIAKDQALVYELVTNRAADGGLSPATAGHNHTEAGNRLYWPVLYHCFGDQAAVAHASSATGYPEDDVYRNQPAYITENMLTTTTNGLTVFVFPFFVPPAFAGRDYELAVRCNQDPDFNVTLETPLGTVVGGEQHMIPDGDGVWACVVSPVSSGVHVVRVRTNMIHRSDESYRRREVYEMCLRPVPDAAASPLPRAPASPSANSITVGDPDASNGWHPVDELLAADYMPTGAVQLINAGNDALLQERAIGLPATGNATLTTTGHDHSGATEHGAEISANVACWSLGAYPKDSKQLGGAGSIYDGFYGQGLLSPAVRNTTFRAVLVGVVRTPASAHASSASPPLNVSVVGYEHGSSKSGCHLAVRVTTTNDVGGTTTRTLTSAGTADDYVLLTSSSGFTFTSGGYTTVLVEIAETSNSSTWSVGLSGVCLYIG